MTLSRSAFEAGWRMLTTRFNVNQAAKDGYYAFLGPRLTDEEYRRACEHLFADAHRFPRPQDFIDAKPERQSEEWEQMRTWSCEECGELGRSLGPPRVRVCVRCLADAGRERLYQLRKKGQRTVHLNAIEVGLGVILEEREGRRAFTGHSSG